MWPMIKKELRENWAYAAAAFAGGLLLLHICAEEQGWFLFGMQKPVAGGSRLTWPLPIVMWASICAWLPALIAIKIVYEDRWRRSWPLLVQLPASRERVVFGKFLAGLMIYCAIIAASAGLIILRLAIPGAWPGPLLLGDFWALAIPWIGGLCVYSLAFLSACRQARWYATKWLPLTPALLVWVSYMGVAHGYVQTHSLGGAFDFSGARIGVFYRLAATAGLFAITVLAVLGIRSHAKTGEY